MDEARKPENLPRNRYRDILPCKYNNLYFNKKDASLIVLRCKSWNDNRDFSSANCKSSSGDGVEWMLLPFFIPSCTCAAIVH